MVSERCVESNLEAIRILIVEDEYILAINLKENLESLGYTVVDTADSAERAIQKAAASRPNLVLMDIRLRGEMDGIQAAERIWNTLQVPIIYVTGHSDKSTVERAALTFPFGYILKPIREKELYVAIQTALSRFEREQFLSTVLQGMGDGVVVVDSQLHVKYLNSVAETLSGWQFQDAKGQIVTDIIPFIDERTQHPIAHPIVSALQDNTTVYLKGPTLLVTKAGTQIPVTDSATPLQNSNGNTTGAVLVFRDDTQRRMQEERDRGVAQAQQLETQVFELQRLNQLKDDFLATTSHELRTPLSNIKMAINMLEMLINRQSDLSSAHPQTIEAINRYLTLLNQQCDCELQMVNNLLEMRSLDAQAYPLQPVEICLHNCLSHIAECFQERIILQHQALEIEIPEHLPLLTTDLFCFTRIISELLNNACKYTPSYERIQMSASLIESPPSSTEWAASVRHPAIEISIHNTGVEISDQYLNQVFEPFYRIPNNDPWSYRGNGLGLALVKRSVTYLKGAIKLNSGNGSTTFTIRLPLTLDNAKGTDDGSKR